MDISLNICRTTGICSTDPVLAYAPGDLFAGTNPNITSLAYDHGNGVLYGLDSLRKTMVRLDPATGLLNTLFPSGIGVSFSRYNGFDISDATGIAYLGSPASDADPQANLYTLDVATGQATLVGTIGDPGDGLLIRGMTVVPWSASAFLDSAGTERHGAAGSGGSRACGSSGSPAQRVAAGQWLGQALWKIFPVLAGLRPA